jgi:hypothetical protein
VYPSELPAPPEPIIGAASVHQILTGWRHALQDEQMPAPEQHLGTTAEASPSYKSSTPLPDT